MIVSAIKTHKITKEDSGLLKILDKYIDKLEENSVVAITSKIVSIAEGNLVSMESVDKAELVKKESEFYLPKTSSEFKVFLTVKNNIIIASAGIDETNGNGFYILWPKDPFGSANKARKFLREKFKLKNLGVIITDSKVSPLRWGVTGFGISYSGIKPLKDYIGKKDLFGKEFEYTKISVIDSLAAAAVLEMGEGSEQTPLAIIEDLKNIEFQNRNPSEEDLEELKIKMEDDLFAPFLKNADWKKGRS